jgi:hypothetical protein
MSLGGTRTKRRTYGERRVVRNVERKILGPAPLLFTEGGSTPILFGQNTPSTSPVYHKDLLMSVVGEKRDRAFSRKVALLYEGRVKGGLIFHEI